MDIQPNNIIIKGEDVYLVDFENSRRSSDLYISKDMMATKGFAAPEQYNVEMKHKDYVFYKADIYGVGAVMLYMLTGKYIDGNVYNCAEDLLAKSNISPQLYKIISDTLQINTDYRQMTAEVLGQQLVNAMKEMGNGNNRVSENKDRYIVSVAGIKSGTGTTYAAFALTSLLSEKGESVVYEENNDSGMVRNMAKAYKEIEFDKGYFVMGKCRLKPKYNKNIHISRNEKIIVRDEGVFDKDKAYGQTVIIVMGAGIMGWPAVCGRLDEINTYIQNSDSKVIFLFNMCSENAYKKAGAKMMTVCAYIPFGDNPMDLKMENAHGMEEIIKSVCGEEKRNNIGNKKKEELQGRKGNKKHRYSIGSKR